MKIMFGILISGLAITTSRAQWIVYDPAAHTQQIIDEAQNIAQAATNQLISYVRKSQKSFQQINQVTLTEVTHPSAGVKLAHPKKKILTSAAVAFVVVGAAFIIVADLLRRRW